MPVTVSQLAIAPVKGMRLQHASEIQLGPYGITGDREFLVIGEDGKLLLTGRTPALVQIEPAWDRIRNLLTLRFPDGDVVQDTPEPGTPATTRMYDGREMPGWIIPGPLGAALSGYLGRPVRLFKRAPEHIGADDEPVTLMSEASLQALAAALDGTAPDPRRFRMTITIAGARRVGRTRLARAGGHHRRGQSARHCPRAALRGHDTKPRIGRHRCPHTACAGPATRQERHHVRRLVRDPAPRPYPRR